MNSLEVAAERVKSALNDYVSTLSLYSDDPIQVISKVGGLQDSIKQFADLSLELNGWSNPFSAPAEATETVDDLASGPADSIVSINARYVVRVTDSVKLGRAFKEISGLDTVEQADPPTAQVNSIFTTEGWDPYKYRESGLEVLKAEWEVSRGLQS